MKFQKLLKKVAIKSDHKNYKHAALVIKGGAVIARGYNHGSQHAEVNALNKLWPSKRRGTLLISIRILKSGGFAIAKPCKACEEFLRINGVKKVIWSDRDGGFAQ